MAERIMWDKYEAAILLEAVLNVEANIESKTDATKNVKPKALPVLSLPISHSNAYLRVVYCYWAGSFPQAAVFLSLQFLWTLMVFLGLITTVWHLSVGGHILYQQVQSLTQTPTSKVLLLFFKPSC